MSTQPKLSIVTGASLVISAMIGTGVFTSLGYQVADTKTGFSILLLWVIGGVVAFCGAVSYAELGTIFKRSGGEYNLLREVYHPSLGFVAGWISVTVGFAAPASLAAMALSSYLNALFPGLPQDHFAAGTILTLSVLHAYSTELGSRVQNISTSVKVLLIIVLVICGFGVALPQPVSIVPQSGSWSEIMSPAYAVSLVYVSYAYTGWNSSIYVIEELENPARNLPRSLFLGTFTVMILYVFLNFIFLYTVPIAQLENQLEVGFLSGEAIFGATGGAIMATAISMLLFSTVSAYVFLGPRVSRVMGEDMKPLRLLARTNKQQVPVNAFVFSAMLSLLFIYTSTFQQVLVYTSFLLILITMFTVGAVFVVRIKKMGANADYRTWGYPVTPIVFVVISIGTLVFVAIDKPAESLVSVGILLLGLLIYFVFDKNDVTRNQVK